MADFPASIRIGYRDYDVVELPAREGEGEGIYGRHSAFLNRIEVRADVKPFERADTLLHEVLHGVWQMADLPKKDEERCVTLISRGLTQVIRDNPHLIAYLQDALQPPLPPG